MPVRLNGPDGMGGAAMIWLSLPLGLAAWVLPVWAKKRNLSRKGWWALVSCLACVLALANVLLGLLQTTRSGDRSALQDITDNLLVCSVLLVLGTAFFNERLLRYHNRQPGFLLVVGLQILFLLPCIPEQRNGSGYEVEYSVLLLTGFLIYYIFTLQETPKEQVSWKVPLGVAVFPLLLLIGEWQAEEALWSSYYFPCQLVTLISTAVLKLQAKRKGEHHGR